jgi:hypothetical protein
MGIYAEAILTFKGFGRNHVGAVAVAFALENVDNAVKMDRF